LIPVSDEFDVPRYLNEWIKSMILSEKYPLPLSPQKVIKTWLLKKAYAILIFSIIILGIETAARLNDHEGDDTQARFPFPGELKPAGNGGFA
jgi:hypothetical protein